MRSWKSQLTQLDDTIDYLELDVIPQLDSGMLQLKDAVRILSQQKTSGMLEISSAMADLAANAAGLDAALTQMDSGMDSLESSRQDALSKADLNHILSMGHHLEHSPRPELLYARGLCGAGRHQLHGVRG